MLKSLGLIGRFYKRIAVISLLISAFLIWPGGDLSEVVYMFWPKLFSCVLILLFVYLQYEHEFYYYKNLGVGKVYLLVMTGLLDLILYVLLSVFAAFVIRLSGLFL